MPRRRTWSGWNCGASLRGVQGSLRAAPRTAGGVQSRMFGVFHDAGYKGLYGGLGCDQIKMRKGVPAADNLMDRMGTTELAANQFRMTQMCDKLAREKISSQERAIETQAKSGVVRSAIQRIGGTPPEKIPAAEHIEQVKKRLKHTRPKLKLDDRDAKGLRGNDGRPGSLLLIGPHPRSVWLDDGRAGQQRLAEGGTRGRSSGRQQRGALTGRGAGIGSVARERLPKAEGTQDFRVASLWFLHPGPARSDAS